MRRLMMCMMLWVGCAHALDGGNAIGLKPALSAQEEALAEHPIWHNLLVLEEGANWVTDGDFYLSGTQDPRLELAANVSALRADPRAYACRFPARAVFLADALEMDVPPECPAFLNWLGNAPRGIDFVFVGEDAVLPPSLFGHALLVVDSDAPKAINFTSDPDTPLLRRAFSTTSGIATFDAYAPRADAYLAQSRALWHYHLALDEEQRMQLLRHAYEIKDAPRQYNFTQANCATEIVRLIDVARGTKVHASLGRIVMPRDALHRLPSDWIKGVSVKQPAKASIFSDPKESAPPRALTTALAAKEGKTALHLSGRLAYHGAWDSDVGYPTWQHLEAGRVKVRLDDRVHLDELAILDARMTPHDRPNWRAYLGLNRAFAPLGLALDVGLGKHYGACSGFIMQKNHLGRAHATAGVGLDMHCQAPINDRARLNAAASTLWRTNKSRADAVSVGGALDLDKTQGLQAHFRLERADGQTTHMADVGYVYRF